MPGVGKTYRALGSVWALVETQKEEKQGVLEISDEEPEADMAETKSQSKDALEKAASSAGPVSVVTKPIAAGGKWLTRAKNKVQKALGDALVER